MVGNSPQFSPSLPRQWPVEMSEKPRFVPGERQRVRERPGKRHREDAYARDIEKLRKVATEDLVAHLEEVPNSRDLEVNLDEVRGYDIEALYASPHEDMPSKRAAIEAARLSSSERELWADACRGKLMHLRRKGFRRPEKTTDTRKTVRRQRKRKRKQTKFSISAPSATLLETLSEQHRTELEGSTAYLVFDDVSAALLGKQFPTEAAVHAACLELIHARCTHERAHPEEPTKERFLTFYYEKDYAAITVHFCRSDDMGPWTVKHVHFLPPRFVPAFACELAEEVTSTGQMVTQ